MENKEKEERNKEIALMIGAVEGKDLWGMSALKLEQFKRNCYSNQLQDWFLNPYFTLSELEFDWDWNWLMEAIKFVSKLEVSLIWFKESNLSLSKNEIIQILKEKFIEADSFETFKFVSDIAKSYNEGSFDR